MFKTKFWSLSKENIIKETKDGQVYRINNFLFFKPKN